MKIWDVIKCTSVRCWQYFSGNRSLSKLEMTKRRFEMTKRRFEMTSGAFVGMTIILLYFISVAQAGYFDPKLKWNTIKTEHFNIHFHTGEAVLAKKVSDVCEKIHNELSPKYDWKPFGRTEIVLTDTTDTSNAHALTLPYNYILLFVYPPTGDSTLNNFDDWITDLIRHEYTHILHIDKYGGIAKPFRWIFGKIISPNGLTPGWVREGLAVVEESTDGRGRNNSSISDMMLRTDILNKQFLHLDQITGLTIDWPAGNSAYIYGGAFWQFLKDKYGEAKLQEFIRRYGDSIWLFSLNNKARKVYDDKNFFKLYKEWKDSLETKYAEQKAAIEAKGLSQLADLVHEAGAIISTSTLSPDRSFIVYVKTTLKGKPEIRKINIDGSGDELLYKGFSTTQLSFFPDGKKLVFSYMSINKRRQYFNDLYELDLTTKKVSSLTSKQRANHPTVAPDGKSIVFVQSENAATQLWSYDIASKKATQLSQVPMFTQLSNPSFAPDGKTIAVSADIKGNRDILLFQNDGKHYRNITNDVAIDNQPSFSADGRSLYFSSDRDGINNIYRYSLSAGKTEKVTNVLTGLFEPQVSGNTLIVKNYNGRGYDLKRMEMGTQVTKHGSLGKLEMTKKGVQDDITVAQDDKLSRKNAKANSKGWAMFAEDPLASYNIENLGQDLKFKKYNAFPKILIPRYVLPGFELLDGSMLVSLALSNNDPIFWHAWSAAVTYRTDAEHLGFNVLYSYNRFDPSFYVGYQDYAVSYGDLYATGSDFFENRRRIFAGVSYPMLRQSISGYYFYENRSAVSTVPAGAVLTPTLGNLSGVGLSYSYSRASKFPKKISPEGGPKVKVNFEMTNGIFGSDNGTEQVILSADVREYIPMPYNKDHGLALRASGGYAWGDRFLQGTFRLGSALGESPLTGTYTRLFQLRGLPQISFSGERALLLSGEYRFPLFHAQRGLGTGPIHLNAAHFALFADWGSVWNGGFDIDKFLLGVGAELRGDFVLGYGLPITGRLGYGIIVDGREFIGRFSDPLTSASIKNGALILELGTSF